MFAYQPLMYDSGFQSVACKFQASSWDPYIEFIRPRDNNY